MLPLCCIFIALGLISALAPDLQAGALIRSVKSLALWILSFCLTVFLALLTIKTSVSGAADGVTLKTAKFLLSSAVPVVGGAVGDAWAAVSGCRGPVYRMTAQQVRSWTDACTTPGRPARKASSWSASSRVIRRTAIRTRIRPVDCWQIVNFKVISPLS